MEAVTGGPTRVVWTQDFEELRDTLGRGSRLRLMGYDSRAGRGERVILPGPGPMLKPLFTPDGERVVYSLIGENATYIVNWDGGDHRRLAEGMAVATWRDPAEGTDWIYLGRERQEDEVFTFSFGRIVRIPLEDSGAEETVWPGPRMAMDNIQLSADGRRACGQFPWPRVGVASFPDGGYERIGTGCWTALAPDNSYIMWALDGAHRNLLMADTRSGDRWMVNVCRAPGVGGHEVYHPRWSNHPRLMVMTGPYTIQDGVNNIGGGGPEVEIHVGRFSEDRRAIEKWVQISDDDHANFFPDLWVRTVDQAPAPAATVALAPATPTGVTEAAWPPLRDDLVFVWGNRDGDNRIKTPDGEVRRGDPEPAARARYGRYLDMDLRRGYFSAPGAGQALAEALEKTGSFTYEAWLTPAGEGEARAVIWGVGPSGSAPATAITIEGGKLCLRRRGSGRPVVLADWEDSGRPRHLAVTVEEGRAAAYLDGVPAGAAPLEPLPRDTPMGSMMYFGGSPEGGTNWSGFMEGIALHRRALTPEEIADQARAGGLRAAGRPPPRVATVRAELTEASAVPSPADIAPYRRGLVVNEYRVVEVLSGELDAERILVAHWAVMDGRNLETARREVGGRYLLRLESYGDRPELQGERLSMDTDNFLLDIYYDIDS